jgi:hypothetical protein
MQRISGFSLAIWQWLYAVCSIISSPGPDAAGADKVR